MTPEEVHRLQAQLGPDTQCIETHISWVILAGEWAYKIKKPVHFSFLDYREPAQRRDGCDAECRLNRRLAPETYIGVVALRSTGAQVILSDDLAATPGLLDYAVKMRRLDADREMDRMLAAGKLTAEDIAVLARKVAAFHLQAERVDLSRQSDPEAYQRDFNDILHEAGTFEQVLGPAALDQLKAVVAISDAFLHTPGHRALIRERIAAGMVRDVHGDLHTRNVFAYTDPVIFDCIEFNAHFRQIDVLLEVAFMCMDLEEQGHEGFSEGFLSAYLAAFPAAMPPEAVPLFLWFKLYRANVRAKVNALQWANSTDPGTTAAEMGAYLALMGRYAAALKPNTGR